MDLVKVIKAIKEDICKLEREKSIQIKTVSDNYDKQIQDLKTALDVNMKMNTICLKCEGRTYIRQCDAAGQNESVKCDNCHGSGIEGVEVDERE